MAWCRPYVACNELDEYLSDLKYDITIFEERQTEQAENTEFEQLFVDDLKAVIQRELKMTNTIKENKWQRSAITDGALDDWFDLDLSWMLHIMAWYRITFHFWLFGLLSRNNMKQVEITKEPVELYKLLKFESIVSSGGQAKFVIGEGHVTLNGEIETQKRKKLVSGDIIEFNNEKFQLRLVSD